MNHLLCGLLAGRAGERLLLARLVPQLDSAGSRVTPCTLPSGLSLADLGQEPRGEPMVGWTGD